MSKTTTIHRLPVMDIDPIVVLGSPMLIGIKINVQVIGTSSFSAKSEKQATSCRSRVLAERGVYIELQPP